MYFGVFILHLFVCHGYVCGELNVSLFICHGYVCGEFHLSWFICHGYVCGEFNLSLFHSLQDKALKFFAKTSSSSPFNLTREIYSSLGTAALSLSFAVAIMSYSLTPSELRLKAWWKVESFMSLPSCDAQSVFFWMEPDTLQMNTVTHKWWHHSLHIEC